MVLNRVNLKEQQHIESQPCLTISPTLVFNSKKHSQVLSAIPERHTRAREPPLPIYIGFNIHSLTHSFKEDGCVAPVCLRKKIFSIGALDNIDHNPSSIMATSSFHGTGISIFQLPMQSNPGESRLPLKIPPSETGMHSLPDHPSSRIKHTTVPACVL